MILWGENLLVQFSQSAVTHLHSATEGAWSSVCIEFKWRGYIVAQRPSEFMCHRHFVQSVLPTNISALRCSFACRVDAAFFWLWTSIIKNASAPDSLSLFFLSSSTQGIWLCGFYWICNKQQWQVMKLYLHCCQTSVLTQHLPIFVWDECLFNYMNINVRQLNCWISECFSIFTWHYRAGLDCLLKVRLTACSDQLSGVCRRRHAQHLLDLLENKEIQQERGLVWF